MGLKHTLTGDYIDTPTTPIREGVMWNCGNQRMQDQDNEWVVFTTPPKVSPVEFKLLFTSAERIAIKTARITDAVLEDAYDILEDARLAYVDLSLASNIGLIDYMASKGLITADRAVQIKAGIIL